MEKKPIITLCLSVVYGLFWSPHFCRTLSPLVHTAIDATAAVARGAAVTRLLHRSTSRLGLISRLSALCLGRLWPFLSLPVQCPFVFAVHSIHWFCLVGCFIVLVTRPQHWHKVTILWNLWFSIYLKTVIRHIGHVSLANFIDVY